jgi:hypothetical protein
MTFFRGTTIGNLSEHFAGRTMQGVVLDPRDARRRLP